MIKLSKKLNLDIGDRGHIICVHLGGYEFDDPFYSLSWGTCFTLVFDIRGYLGA